MKIKKKDLARGSRLNPEQIWDSNLDGVATNLSSANTANLPGLNQQQYEQGNGTFRMHWNIPWIGSRWTRYNGIDKPYIIPFCLLPFQEFLNPLGQVDENTPSIIMTEFSYGFDTRDEAAFITDASCGPGVNPAPAPGLQSQNWNAYSRATATFPGRMNNNLLAEWNDICTNLNHGKLFYEVADRGAFKFTILKKPMDYFNPNIVQDSYPTEEVYNLPVPMAAFINSDLRLNPHFEKDLNINMDPYSTYCLGINLPKLHDDNIDADDTQDNLAIVNLNIVIKFKHRLVTRDTAAVPGAVLPGSRDPNMVPFHAAPSATTLHKTQDPVTLNSPAVSTTIEADTADGVNTSLTQIDTKFRDKLRAGLDASSNKPVSEHLCQDAGYDIIAIPLWNNQWGNQFTFKHAFSAMGPYGAGSANEQTHVGVGGSAPGTVFDNDYGVPTDSDFTTRAIMPIDYPFTIHHVVVAANMFTADWYPGVSTRFDRNMWMDAWDDGSGAGLAASPFPNFLTGFTPPAPADYNNPAGPYSDSVIVSHIGLGVGTGRQGGYYGYRQVGNWDNLYLNASEAAANVPATPAGNFVLDKIHMGYPTEGVFKDMDVPNWKLHYLPMNSQGVAGAGSSPGLFNGAAAGYGTKATAANFDTIQDEPHFCGNSFLCRNEGSPPAALPPSDLNYVGTSRRTGEQAGAAYGRPAADQWLEVRWSTRLENAAGASVPWSDAGPFARTNVPVWFNNRWVGDQGKIIHGYGGHWMYLIVKKTTVSNANWQNTNLEGGL